MTIYAGIDYSMNSPAITVWDSTKGPLKFSNCISYNFGKWSRVKDIQGDHGNICILKQPTTSCDEERFLAIAQWAKAVLVQHKVERASLEGYSYGSKGVSFEIGENTGCLKQVLFTLKIPFFLVEPTTVKKNATGNGNAGKDKLYNAFLEEEGVLIEHQIGYPKFNDAKLNVKIDSVPWELKPVDDIIDSYFILKSHPDMRNM